MGMYRDVQSRRPNKAAVMDFICGNEQYETHSQVVQAERKNPNLLMKVPRPRYHFASVEKIKTKINHLQQSQGGALIFARSTLKRDKSSILWESCVSANMSKSSNHF